MDLKNSRESYGLVAKTLHWAVALLILVLLGMGFFMAGLEFSPAKLELYTIHKSFGMIVLVLAGLRICWRWINVSPEELATHKPWEKVLSKIAHVALYAAMIIMPLSGWLMSSAAEFPNSFFGLFNVPALMGKNEAVFHLMRNVHATSALVLILIIALHMAGAFKHHFIDRDDTLRRMASRKVGFIGGAVIALVAGVLWLAPVALIVGENTGAANGAAGVNSSDDIAGEISADVAEGTPDGALENAWAIDYDASSIQFEVTQYGTPFTGRFSQFSGHIVFDPQDLEGGTARIEIKIASINTGAQDRDEQAKGVEWFDVAEFPVAVFEAERFTALADNRYEVEGNLTIRGNAVPLTFPFDLTIDEQDDGRAKATMSAQTQLDRLAFGVGQGQWQATDAIGGVVLLKLYVEAYR